MIRLVFLKLSRINNIFPSEISKDVIAHQLPAEFQDVLRLHPGALKICFKEPLAADGLRYLRALC